jgi:hypothetical protein
MNSHFNLYYLHWWTLTRLVFEVPRYRAHALELVRRGGGTDAFEEIIGPVDQVQTEWHSYVRHLKATLSGGNRDRRELREGPKRTNSFPEP